MMTSVNLIEHTIEAIEELIVELPNTSERRGWLARLTSLRFARLSVQMDGRRPLAELQIATALIRLREEIEDAQAASIARDARGFASHHCAVA